MPSFWQQIPFIRILFSFLIGIILADHKGFSNLNALVICGLSTIVYAYNHFFSKKLNHVLQNGIFQLILFIPLGIFCLNQQKSGFQQNHFDRANYTALLVQTTQKPQKNKLGWKAEAFVISGFTTNGEVVLCKGKLVLYSKSDSLFPLNYGNQFLIKSGIQEIVSNRNPGGFDYQKYMSDKGIFYQCFLTKSNAQLYSRNHGNKILSKTYTIQDFIHISLEKYVIGKNEIAIAEALLYGYDKDIDDETTEAYSKTGTLHVLAVSGMHVGLIFMILSWLLSPIAKLPKGKLWVAILQFVGIWLYALLCGLSPSILRACVMFSFVIIGKQLSKSSNPFNSLSAAGFLLLCIQPLMIYNVGFQLSFAAVAGILGFYPYLNLLVQFKNTFVNEIWKIIAISMAAQTLTLPISFYYFHQFPSYFLPANLLIIPLSTIIIYAGILLLLLSPIHAAAQVLGFIISKLITLTSAISIFIANLPYSTIENINWPPLQIIAYYLFGITLVNYFSTRNLFALKCMLCIAIMLSFSGLNQNIITANTNKLCIYSSNSNLLIQIHRKNHLTIWHNASDSSSIYKKWVQPYKNQNKLKNEEWNTLDSSNYWINMGPEKHLLLVQQN
ncbi:MAG: ComEC family competence protein, partial [Bacteroidia bacterium]|nr:ComEC family competence protein [Bacteroidia bacterium]